MSHQQSPAREQLRSAGLRITAPRVAVLDWLAGHPHATADQVAAGVREELGPVSAQTVRDVLGACAAAELVRRSEPAGQPVRYEARTRGHHLVCRSCGRTEDVGCVPGAVPCRAPAAANGFVLDRAEVVFRGLCPDCLATRRAGEAPEFRE